MSLQKPLPDLLLLPDSLSLIYKIRTIPSSDFSDMYDFFSFVEHKWRYFEDNNNNEIHLFFG